MHFIDRCFKGMAFGANTIHGALLANQACASRETKRRPAYLLAVRSINVQIEQACGWYFRLDVDATSFDRFRVVIDAENGERTEEIADFSQ